MADVITPATDWTTGLTDDMKGYVANKGFRGPSDVLDSYRNFEKLQGVPQDRLLKLPDKSDGPEMDAIWQRLGAPKEAKEYGIDVKKVGDEKTAEMLQNAFFEAKVSKSAADKILAKLAEHGTSRSESATQLAKNAIQTGEANLKIEWGSAFESNQNIAKAGAQAMGLDAKAIDALSGAIGHENTVKLLHKFGSATGEGKFIQGKAAGGMLAPQAAKDKIKELTNDSVFRQRLVQGDVEANNEWTNLHKMIYQGEINL